MHILDKIRSAYASYQEHQADKRAILEGAQAYLNSTDFSSLIRVEGYEPTYPYAMLWQGYSVQQVAKESEDVHAAVKLYKEIIKKIIQVRKSQDKTSWSQHSDKIKKSKPYFEVTPYLFEATFKTALQATTTQKNHKQSVLVINAYGKVRETFAYNKNVHVTAYGYADDARRYHSMETLQKRLAPLNVPRAELPQSYNHIE